MGKDSFKKLFKKCTSKWGELTIVSIAFGKYHMVPELV